VQNEVFLKALAGPGGGGAMPSSAKLKAAGSRPAWVVSLLPRAWGFVCPDLFD
jgi:hypothetical protein